MPTKQEVMRKIIEKKIKEKTIGVSSIDTNETEAAPVVAQKPQLNVNQPNRILNKLAVAGAIPFSPLSALTQIQRIRDPQGLKEASKGLRGQAKILPDVTQVVGSIASKTPLGLIGRGVLGAVSRGFGEVIRQGLEKQLGGEQPDIKQILKEAGYGSAGEALVGRGSAAERIISKVGGRIVDVAKSLDQKIGGKGAKVLGNFIRFTTGRQHIDDATELVVKEGADKVLKPEYMTDDVPKELTRKIKDAVNEFDLITKDKYRKLIQPFKEAGIELPSDEIVSSSLDNMAKSGLITVAREPISESMPVTRKWLIANGYDVPGTFKDESLDAMNNSIEKLMKISSKTSIPLEIAIEDRKMLGKQIYGIKSRAIQTAPGKLPQDDMALDSIRKSYRDSLHKYTGGPDGDFAKADALYSERENILGEVFNRTKTWKDLDKTARTYIRLSGPEKIALQQIDEMVSPNNRFINDAMRYSAAQIYKDESTNMFRTGLIGTIVGGLGGSFLPGDSGTRIATGATVGAVLGTPKAVAYILKGGQSTKEILSKLAKLSAKGLLRGAPTIASEKIKEKL